MKSMDRQGWFTEPGAYVLVDGQFGSTGKGALAAYLGQKFGDRVTVFTTNAGPNSGHTGYFPPKSLPIGMGEYDPSVDMVRVVTRQLPVAAYHRPGSFVYLNGGAVIDPNVLKPEVLESRANVFVHPNAAIIEPDHMDDVPSLKAVASTGKGVGQALARRVLREPNIARLHHQALRPAEVSVVNWNWEKDIVFVETAQGFSLGLLSPEFYPYTTSRETTVMQALADARIPAQELRKVIMTLRTYPIRVGNTKDGESGGWYSDQTEITWEAIGVSPELTTVTKRVRRVATWSPIQFIQAIEANRPDALFINFLNYIPKENIPRFVQQSLLEPYEQHMSKKPDFILGGYGPFPQDIAMIYSRAQGMML